MKNIFVSSTFRDMQAERDILHERVLPAINEQLNLYGESAGFTDLRWGVNTADLEDGEGARKVLKVCLGEIEKCRPYMIVLLGDRYGWVPDTETMLSTLEEELERQKERGRDLSRLIRDPDKSVTQLEIEYGALEDADQLARCFFYVRNPFPDGNMSAEERRIYFSESTDEQRQQKKLKLKIGAKCPDHVRYYDVHWDKSKKQLTGLDAFAEMVIEDITGLIREELGEVCELDWQEREELGFRNLIRSKSQAFVGQEDLLAELDVFMSDDSRSLFFLTGESGSGKSSVLARYAEMLEVGGKTAVFPFFCGNSSRTSIGENIIEYYSELLMKKISRDPDFLERFSRDHIDVPNPEDARDFKEKRKQLTALFRYWIQTYKQPVVLLIDALDQLRQTDVTENDLWLPEEPVENLKIIVSTTERVKEILSPAFSQRMTTAVLKPLTEGQVRETVLAVLEQNHKEPLKEEVLQEILRKENSGNHLYLSFVLQRLLMLDKEDYDRIEQDRQAVRRQGIQEDGQNAITRYMKELITRLPEDVEELCAAVAEEAGRRINPDLTDTLMKLIATSRAGLRKSDLAAICNDNGIAWSEIDFVYLKRYLSRYFTDREDGLLDFSHKSIRSGIRKTIPDAQRYERMIFKHLQGLEALDIVKTGEMLYFAYRLDDPKVMSEFMVHYVVFQQFEEFTEQKLRIWINLSRDIMQIAMDGGQDWLCTQCGRWMRENTSNKNIAHFFYRQGRHAFYDPGTPKQLKALLSILEALVEGMEDYVGNTKKDLTILEQSGDFLLEISKLQERLLRPVEAADAARKALQAYEDVDREWKGKWVNRDNLITAHLHLASLSDRDAQEHYQKALEICNRMEEEDRTREEEDRLGNAHFYYHTKVKIHMKLGMLQVGRNMPEESHRQQEQLRQLSESYSGDMEGFRPVFDEMMDLIMLAEIDKKEEKWEAYIPRMEKIAAHFERQAAEQQKAEDYRILALVYMELAGANKKLSRYEEAIRYYKKQVVLEEKLEAILDDSRSRTNAAQAFMTLGNLVMDHGSGQGAEEAREYFHTAIRYCEKLLPSHENDIFCHTRMNYCFYMLSLLAYKRVDADEALELTGRAIEEAEKALEIKSTPKMLHKLAFAHNRMAWLYEQKRGLEQATRHYEAYVSIDPELEEMEAADICIKIGNMYLALHQFEKGISFFDEGMRRLERCDEVNTQDWTRRCSNLQNQKGNCLGQLQRYEEAERAYCLAMELWKSLEPPLQQDDEYNLALCHANLVNIHHSMGNLDKALEHQTLAMQMFEKLYEQGPERYRDKLSNAYDCMGFLYYHLNRPEESAEYRRKYEEMKGMEPTGDTAD